MLPEKCAMMGARQDSDTVQRSWARNRLGQNGKINKQMKYRKENSMEKETMEIDVDLTDLMFDLENYVPAISAAELMNQPW